ncbi:MAG: stress response translation initiation inhibitor YciH [Candidatus Aenigmarchaeota archaeon]|nr:stress response translation initiation inhibitor YciH [Candidatus Aenigmarchaeota archaeon]MCX8179274.1 stress response translation initiation inhibitor YciH [Candidatus Aenigmarchaeota archaeon]
MVERIGVCPTCGLPTDICTCKIIERETAKIKIYMTTRKFGKPVTLVEGIDENSVKSVLKTLKQKLACGGSYKDKRIELQGNHVKKVKEILLGLGFDKNMIEES